MQLKTYINKKAKGKGTQVLPIVWMVLAFFSEHFQKASRDKTEYNDMQMKHMMDSFEAQKERKMAKKEKKLRKMEQK